MRKKEFAEVLLKNYNPNDRPMPWKGIKDPYLIWLSEIILQQTRVEQGWDYFLKFKNEFPNVDSLAKASEDKVLKLWEGLGYYSRARNMHSAAKYIVHELDGKFPEAYNEILKLKGVGPYTAAAIASFAFNEAKAVLDGNVFRVLSRFFEIKTPIDSTEGKKLFSKLANELIEPKQAALYNQAIMDLGAVICQPKSPLCIKCPLIKTCKAYRNKRVDELPVKSKKIKKRKRYFNFYLISDDKRVLIRKRSKGDIWQGLYELPNIEDDFNFQETDALEKFEGSFTNSTLKNKKIRKINSLKHQLTHQEINAVLFELKIDKLPDIVGFQAISINNLNNFAFPRLISLLLKV